MKHAAFEVIDTKADPESGIFEATVAAFGNVDRAGDRIVAGAFTKTLADWRRSGDPIPVILSHEWNDPMRHIGVADPNHVVQTAKGLHVRGTLDVADNRVAKQVHKLLKRRSLREFSFGYTVPRGGERRRNGANELIEIDLIEVGPTLKGANPATELHAVKSAMTGESNAPTDTENRWDAFFEGDSGHVPTIEDLRRKERSLGLGLEAVRDEFYSHTKALLGHGAPEPTTTAVKAVNPADNRPIRVRSFEC